MAIRKLNKILTGKIMVLRPPRPGDRDKLIALNKASISFHRGLANPPKTPAQYSDYLSRSQKPDNECFLICRISDKAIVGTINLSQIFRKGFQNACLGYYIGAPFAGQGYMTDALQVILRYAFTFLKLHRLEANIQPHNKASIKLVQHAGFVMEGYSKRYLKICGRWRDHQRWAILSENWKK